MTAKNKEIIYLIILMAIYLLCVLRYFPDQPLSSLRATGIHLLDVAPYVIGLTIFTVSILNKISGERLRWDRIARIYLTLGLIIEFFYGLYNYLDLAQKSANL
jgi:hypothetical protein